MPIGKNSIKRVANNGYSNVKTSAPDMQMSEISLIDEAKAHTEKILAPKVAKPKAAAKKTSGATQKKTCGGGAKKSSASKSTTAKKAAPKTQKAAFAKADDAVAAVQESKNATDERFGEGYVNLGGELPVYLL